MDHLGQIQDRHGSVGRTAPSGCPAHLEHDYVAAVNSCTWPFMLGSLCSSIVLLPLIIYVRACLALPVASQA